MVDFAVLGLTLLLSVEFCHNGFAKHVQATAKTAIYGWGPGRDQQGHQGLYGPARLPC